MKKVIFSLLLITGLGLVTTKTNAQTTPLKIGVFDIDNFVQRMPETQSVIKPKIDAFQRDSLGPQRDQLDTAFSIAQSTYTNDSLAKKSPSILSYDRKTLQDKYQQVAGWQQYAQNAVQRKYYELAKPSYDKVIAAYKKAIADNKVTLVLNPQAIIDIPDPKSIVNLFDVVAAQMGIKLLSGQEDNGGGQ